MTHDDDSVRPCTRPLDGPPYDDAAGGRAAFEAGDAIDRYLVVGPLGRGGMGEVLRAYDPVLRREVALKVVRFAGGSEEARGERRARLVREAQALAKLAHPNVVAVFDVGVVGAEAFVAMELVEGETLRAWLLAPRAPEAIVHAFVAAAEGLAAAHDAGLVHRDFKPDNVMVGRDGRVRVLDFGLARAHVAPRAGDAPIDDDGGVDVTRAGAVIGTPRYMAPEQWRGERGDARTDQFAFAVALHEALFRAHPFAGARSDRAEPIAPSRLPPFRDGRRADSIRRALARAMARDPAARHPSLRELVAALRRPPVRARRWLFAAAVAASIAAPVAIVAARASRSSPCDASAAELGGVWDDARRGEVDAAFAGSGIGGAAEHAARLRAQLDAYAAEWTAMRGDACRATRERGAQSEALMDLRMRCLGRLRDRLRGFVDGVEHAPDRKSLLSAVEAAGALPPVAVCADADALARAVPLPDDPAARAATIDVERAFDALSAQAYATPGPERIAAAEALAARADATHHAPAVGEARLLVGVAQLAAGKTADAARSFEASAQAAARGRDDRTEARAWAGLIEAYGKQSLYEKALTLEPVARAAIARQRDPSEAEAALDAQIGWMLRELGRFDEARARYEASLAKAKALPRGRDHATAVAEGGLGVVAKEQARYEEARAHYERAIALSTAALGERHPTTLRTLNNLAVTLKYLGRKREARAIYERVRDAYAALLEPDHPDHGLPLANLGNLYREEGRYADAKASFTGAMRVWEKAYGPRHLPLAHLSADLANVLTIEGDYAGALASYERALAIAEGSVGAESWHTARMRAGMASCHAKLGAIDRALDESARALAIYGASGNEPSVRVDLELVRADVLWVAGRRGEALGLARAAAARAAKEGGGDPEARARIDAWLAAHA